MHQLEKLGWQWRENGAIITARIDGRTLQIFVPLSRVWASFGSELHAVGAPCPGGVGAPMSVGGLWGWVSHAAKSAVSAVVPKAIQRAASNVVATARRYGGHALNAAKTIGTNKYFRAGLAGLAVAIPVLAPAALAVEAANRIYSYYQDGLAAARAIRAGVGTARDVARAARGLNYKNALGRVVRLAHQGDRRAQQVMGAFQTGQHRAAPRGLYA